MAFEIIKLTYLLTYLSDVCCDGKGAFLIPYLLAMFVAGYPLMLMEYALGQYGRQGVVGVWRACPLFQGLSTLS